MSKTITKDTYYKYKDCLILHDEDDWDGKYKTYGEMWLGEGYRLKEKQILQFSIDVEESDETTEAAIRELLELAGISVVGVSWRARWKSYKDYENGVCCLWD